MWKHLRAIILLPGIVMIVIPGLILWLAGTDSFGLWQSVPASRVVLPVIGGICICLGLLLMVATIRLFVTVGKGTLAPWEPTQRLVVQGVYRHVRNPMISGDSRPAGGVAAHSFPAALLLVPCVRSRQRLLHPALGRAWARQTIWRRLPELQTERAEMGSEVDAVGRWVQKPVVKGGQDCGRQVSQNQPRQVMAVGERRDHHVVQKGARR